MNTTPLIRIWLAIAIILLLLGTSLTSAQTEHPVLSQPAAKGTWLYVGGNGPGNYTKIQDAIDNATDTDTIYVYSGIYNENIVINNSISLIGQNRATTTILGANGSDIVRLQDCSVELTGFTIQRYNKTNYLGLNIGECYSSYIDGNDIVSCSIGIDLSYSESTIISNNTVRNCTHGMLIALIANITITQNRFEGINDGWGIELGAVEFGIQYKNYITKNSFINYSVGLALFGAWALIIQENNFIGNQQHAVFITSFFNKWNQNYWGQSSRLPHIIPGSLGGLFINKKLPLINVDWHPAQTPYTIPG